MTQSYNLSQLANNLNTAGQLDATDGLVNAVPVANGGTGNTIGRAASATILADARTIALTGDLAYTSPPFDGSANVTAAATLANTTVTPGSYTAANITVDSKGRVTAAASGPLSSLTAGTGITLTGTGAVTVAAVVSTGGVGTYATARLDSDAAVTRNVTYAGALLCGLWISGEDGGYVSFGFTGTWRAISPVTSNNYFSNSSLTSAQGMWLFQRIA